MATLCKYADIGKKAQDLFIKNLGCGVVTFNLKSGNQTSGSGFSIEAASSIEEGKVQGVGEFRNTFPGTDMKMSSKWYSDNSIQTEVNMGTRLIPGANVNLLGKFDPKAGNMAGGVQVEFKNEFMYGMVEAQVAGDGKPHITPSFVVTSDGWLGAMHCYLHPSTSKIMQPQFTFGYEAGSYSVYGLLNEKNQLLGSLYQKVNGNMETAVLVKFPYGKVKQTSFEYALGYELDRSHRLQAKVNTSGILRAAISKNFGSGITFSVCGQLDGRNIKSGAHKVGMAIEMDW